MQARVGARRALTGRERPWTDITREPLLNQRKVIGISNGGHTWQPCQSRNQSIGEAHALRTRQTRAARPESQDVRRVVSTLDIRQPQKAVNQQGSPDEQHDSHRDLGHDEGAADSMAHLFFAEQIRVALARLPMAGMSPNSRPAKSATLTVNARPTVDTDLVESRQACTACQITSV